MDAFADLEFHQGDTNSFGRGKENGEETKNPPEVESTNPPSSSNNGGKEVGRSETTEVGTFWENDQGISGDTRENADNNSATPIDQEEGNNVKAQKEAMGDATDEAARSKPTEMKTSSSSSSISQHFTAMNTSITGKESREDRSSSSEWGIVKMMNRLRAQSEASVPPSSSGESSTTTKAQPNGNIRATKEKSGTAGGNRQRYTYLNFIDKMRKPQAKPQARKLNQFVKQYIRLKSIGEAEMKAIHRFIVEAHAGVSHNVLWREASELELDNVFESLEKCILLKLYAKVFFAGPAEQQVDLALEKIIFCHQFLKPSNLDIKDIYYDAPVWDLAQGELKRMNQYKAPRDKIVCLLNCCKMILNLLKKAKEKAAGGDTMDPDKLKKKQGLLPSADDFLPILIYIVLKARVPNLHLNIRYIEISRHPRKLSGEAAYYFTNLKSAVAFIERLSTDMLSIERELYEGELKAAEQQWEEAMRKKRKKSAGANNAASPQESGATDVGRSSSSIKPTTQPNRTSESSEAKAKLDPSVFQFYHTRVDDLKVSDVPKLLEEYKRMANLLIKLQTQGR